MAGSSDRDVEVDVLARDKTSKPVRQVTRAYERLKKQVDQAVKAQEKTNKTTRKWVGTMLTAARSVAKVTATVASFVSLLGPMTVGLLGAAKAAAAFGKGVAGMGPLAAFLPSIAGSLALIIGTVKLIGPGLGRAMTPIVRQFQDADGNATRFTRRLQDLASRGVEPLARQFVKVNFPRIAAGMERIARSTNRVVVGVGKWVNSAEGQRLIEIITTRTANAMERLAPKIEKAVIALGKLALRAGDKGIQKLADTVGRILDAFTRWANSTSIEDIKKALEDLSGYFGRVRDAFNVVREIGRWLSENEAKVRKFANAIAMLGLALGLLTGNPFAVAIAGLSLLITNWDTAKAKLSGAAGWWSNLWNRIKNNPAIQQLVTEVKTHFASLRMALGPIWQQITTTVLPQLQKLKDVVLRDLVPAVSSFIAAVSPIVIWLVTKLGPVVAATFGMVVGIITGALKVIAGIFNVVSAVIRGDWSKFWHGIRQILSGNAQIIVAVFKGAWRILGSVASAGVTGVLKVVSTLGSRIVGLFRGAGSWLAGIGRSIVEGLANGIRNAWGLVSGAVSGLIDKAKSAIPGPLRGALNFSGAEGWRPAQYAMGFAGGGNFAAGSGGSRAGGPTEVSVANTVNVALDGAPFYAYTARAITAHEDRRRWRDGLGRR